MLCLDAAFKAHLRLDQLQGSRARDSGVEELHGYVKGSGAGRYDILKDPTCFFREQSWDILPCPLRERSLADTQSDSVIRSSFWSLLHSTLDHLRPREEVLHEERAEEADTIQRDPADA
jgi:hypothetical protein